MANIAQVLQRSAIFCHDTVTKIYLYTKWQYLAKCFIAFHT